MKSKAILTFDLEFWYNVNFLKKHLPKKSGFDDYVKESIEPILGLLNNHNHKATFFVLGKIAKKYPEIIKKISDLGHEIASHGYSHKPLYELSEAEFKKEIKSSKMILEKIINKRIKGFRAPNFSLNKKTKWALNIIKNYNFQYDSSAHPLKFTKSFNKVREIPPSLGGFYFRIIPLWLYIILIKYFSKTKIPTLYFHPYEFFELAPKIESAPWWKKKIKYWGTKNAWKKFKKLMKKYKFISIEQYLHESATH